MKVKLLIITLLGTGMLLGGASILLPADLPPLPPKSEAWLREASNPVVNPSRFTLPQTGERGMNAADPCVIYSRNTKQWHIIFSTHSEKLDIQFLKQATSPDAINWQILEGEALGLGVGWDSKSVETCSLVEVPNTNGGYQYYLYYSATDTVLGNDKDVYRMGVAVSSDLHGFIRISETLSPKQQTGMLFDAIDAFPQTAGVVSGVVTDPSVIWKDGQFQMWYFCAALDSNDKYIDGGICHATSMNGINWKQYGALNSLLNHDTKGVIPQQPTVIYNERANQYEALLVIDDPAYIRYGVPGLAVGGYYRATSQDGKNWLYANSKSYDFTWNHASPAEDKGLANGPALLLRNNTYYLFYPVFTSKDIPEEDYYPFTWAINLATMTP